MFVHYEVGPVPRPAPWGPTIRAGVGVRHLNVGSPPRRPSGRRTPPSPSSRTRPGACGRRRVRESPGEPSAATTKTFSCSDRKVRDVPVGHGFSPSWTSSTRPSSLHETLWSHVLRGLGGTPGAPAGECSRRRRTRQPSGATSSSATSPPSRRVARGGPTVTTGAGRGPGTRRRGPGASWTSVPPHSSHGARTTSPGCTRVCLYVDVRVSVYVPAPSSTRVEGLRRVSFVNPALGLDPTTCRPSRPPFTSLRTPRNVSGDGARVRDHGRETTGPRRGP